MAEEKKFLKDDDVSFKWTHDKEEFVVRCYAEFDNAASICEKVIEAFFERCDKDIEKYGHDAFAQFLLRRIWLLSPNYNKFPKKFQPIFDEHRKTYLADIDNSYLAHSKNRLQALDNQLLILQSRLAGEPNLQNLRNGVLTCIEIIKEAREEMNKSGVDVEFSAKQEAEKLTLALRAVISSLPSDTIKELITSHERGHPITLALESVAGSANPDPPSGNEPTGEPSG